MFKKGDISLRPAERGDIDWIYETENNVDNWSFTTNYQQVSKVTILQFLETNTDIIASGQQKLIIEFQGKIAGSLDIFDLDIMSKKAGLGIVVLEEFRNKKIAKTALELIEDYIFDLLQLKQLYAYVSVNNEASKKLFGGMGYEKSSWIKKWILIQGTLQDVFLFQKINER